MKLVIDIDKNVYKDLKEYFGKEYSDAVGNCGLGTELAIANGTPLEEELEKIKDEIEDTGAYEQEVNGKTEFLKGITFCLSIIDKYKVESEIENDTDKPCKNIIKNEYIFNGVSITDVKKTYASIQKEEDDENIITKGEVIQWIPTSERQPEHTGDYLVTMGINYDGTGMFDCIRVASYNIHFGWGLYEKNDIHTLFGEITAWAELPKIYS